MIPLGGPRGGGGSTGERHQFTINDDSDQDDTPDISEELALYPNHSKEGYSKRKKAEPQHYGAHHALWSAAEATRRAIKTSKHTTEKKSLKRGHKKTKNGDAMMRIIQEEAER